MDTSSINAQSIFDDNAAMLKLSWLTGHEGWERGFSSESVANATSSADLVGHLNLIHPTTTSAKPTKTARATWPS
jgi:HPr kinase/phosphorylase